MSDLETFSERLRKSLEPVLTEVEVSADPSDGSRMLMYVVSPSFEHMEDGDRQHTIWKHALKTFDYDEQDRIEFIYTDAPSEIEQA